MEKTLNVDLSGFKSFYKKTFFLLLLGILIPILVLYGTFPWECPIYHFFGIHCPGCGITRALICLFKGDFTEAFQYNPHIYLLVFGFSAFMCLFISDKVKGSNYLWHTYNRINVFLNRYSIFIFIVCFLYVVIFTIVRNR
ncbi:MAG: DUF2752 domain-containing protein [Duncaniella sp.]|nr:DUF2752 domain-containing protein [Duncaniella sp.]